jgi:hypothetical protein
MWTTSDLGGYVTRRLEGISPVHLHPGHVHSTNSHFPFRHKWWHHNRTEDHGVRFLLQTTPSTWHDLSWELSGLLTWRSHSLVVNTFRLGRLLPLRDVSSRCASLTLPFVVEDNTCAYVTSNIKITQHREYPMVFRCIQWYRFSKLYEKFLTVMFSLFFFRKNR